MPRRIRRRIVPRAAVGTAFTTACAALSSGWVRSGTGGGLPLDEPDFFAPSRQRVARVKLPAAPLLGLAVHGHGALGQQLLRLAARADDPRHLERLPQPDHVALDLEFPHGADGSARARGAGRQSEVLRLARLAISS